MKFRRNINRKKYINIQRGRGEGVKFRRPSIFVVNRISSRLSILLSASTAATNYRTAPTCTATTITPRPCSLNAEFQHFIHRFNKISLLYTYP